MYVALLDHSKSKRGLDLSKEAILSIKRAHFSESIYRPIRIL